MVNYLRKHFVWDILVLDTYACNIPFNVTSVMCYHVYLWNELHMFLGLSKCKLHWVACKVNEPQRGSCKLC